LAFNVRRSTFGVQRSVFGGSRLGSFSSFSLCLNLRRDNSNCSGDESIRLDTLQPFFQVDQDRRTSPVSDIHSRVHKSIAREFLRSIPLRSKRIGRIPGCHPVRILLPNWNKPTIASSAMKWSERDPSKTLPDLIVQQSLARIPGIAERRQTM